MCLLVVSTRCMQARLKWMGMRFPVRHNNGCNRTKIKTKTTDLYVCVSKGMLASVLRLALLVGGGAVLWHLSFSVV